jgi:hypothetical protein
MKRTQLCNICPTTFLFNCKYPSNSSNAFNLVIASRLDTFFKITTSSGSKSGKAELSKPSNDEGVEGRELLIPDVAGVPTN